MLNTPENQAIKQVYEHIFGSYQRGNFQEACMEIDKQIKLGSQSPLFGDKPTQLLHKGGKWNGVWSWDSK